jgi:hypothetical protein
MQKTTDSNKTRTGETAQRIFYLNLLSTSLITKKWKKRQWAGLIFSISHVFFYADFV